MRETFLFFTFIFVSALAIHIPCRHDSSIKTLEDLVNCFEQYTVPEGYYTSENAKHCSAQPDKNQLSVWRDVVTKFWGIDLGRTSRIAACDEMQHIDLALSHIYESWIFRDASGLEFCVLSEMYTDVLDRTVYSKGWGFMVVPLVVKKSAHVLHLSVPRPFPGMAQYAATVFKQGQARSLLINGRHPRAIRHSSSCVQPSNSCEVFHKTDAVYDKDEPFYLATKILVEKERYTPEFGGTRCRPSSCAHVSLLPMPDATCGDVNILLSDGFGLLQFADGWYSSPTSPVRRIMARIYRGRAAHPSPSLPAGCGVSASQNVLGRAVNAEGSVEPISVCSGSSSWLTIRGNFIQIELDSEGLKSEVAPVLGAALMAAYTPT